MKTTCWIGCARTTCPTCGDLAVVEIERVDAHGVAQCVYGIPLTCASGHDLPPVGQINQVESQIERQTIFWEPCP